MNASSLEAVYTCASVPSVHSHKIMTGALEWQKVNDKAGWSPTFEDPDPHGYSRFFMNSLTWTPKHESYVD